MPPPLHVLIVEDKPDDAELIALELRRAGLAPEWQRVDTEPDFLAALGARPDIILSDFRLQAFTAFEVLQWLQERGNDTPCIIVTGTLGDEQAIECIKQGAADYLLKDRLARLGQAVVKALEQNNIRKRQEQTEATIRQREEQYVSLLHTVEGIVWEMDAATFRFTFVSQQAECILGYPTDEWLSEPNFWATHLHPEDRERCVAYCAKQVNLRKSHELEYRMIAADGRTVWLRDIVSVHVDREDNVRLRGIMVSIAERKRAEHDLVVSERRYRRLFETAKDGILILDYETGQIVDVNPFLTMMLGFSREEMMGKTLWDIGFAHDALDSKLNFDDLKRRGYVRYDDLPLETKDHRTFFVEFISNVYPVDKQNVIQCNIRDITERKRTQETLQKTNERLTHLVQASPMGITILNLDGLVQFWNPAAERIFGWKEAEVLGQPLPTIPPDKREEHLSSVRQVLNGRPCTGLELIRQRKDGSLINISLSAAALQDSDGRVTGILGIMADITERKQMEQKAARLEELATLGQLLGGVAHELKNPLFVLSGRLQLVSEKLAAREYDTVGVDFKKIEDAAQRMTAVAQRFLSFTQPHSMQRAQCSVNVPLQKTVDFLSNELMKNHIQTTVSLGRNLPTVWCDERELHQVFTNLIMNASYAMAKANDRGMLTVSTALNGTTVEIRIQDDGPGVALEHRAKLFEPFFTTKPLNEGTGLGLWIVKTSIINMRGTITCETDMGKGATFIIGLPAMTAQESS